MSTRSRKTRLLELDQPERESIIVDATGELLPIDTDNEDFSRLLVDADGENILQPDGLVTEYEQYCRRRASDHIESGRPDLSTSWKQEADAWALVRILLSERYGTDEDVDESGNPVQRGPLNTLCSDFGHSYEVSKGVREHIIVKQWLESIAPDFQPSSWAIGEDQVVSELDPDAPTRQNRRMAPEDQSYETELLRTIYEYLRRGRLSDAFHLCAACDQPWRIASLGGGAFRDDPFVDGFKDFDGEQFHGNENRMLWKAVCYQIALDENAHPYERAIYGVLSGDVKNALSACHSWEDHIWVRYHAMIEALTSKALCDMPKPFAFDQEISLPLPNVDLEPHTIFTDLSKSEDARISREASEPFHIIQAHLILNSLDVLFASLSAQLIEMEQNLDTPAIAGLPRVLRFSAHLILLLREMGVVEVAEHSHHVHFLLRKYIEMLMVAGKGDLIAMYIAFLPSEMQVDCYSSFLQDVNEDLETRYALAMAGTEYLLDMPRICLATVDRIFRRSCVLDPLEREVPVISLCSTQDAVPESDYILIRALEWLEMDESQIEEKLDHANLLVRRFLIQGHVQSVYRLIQEVGLTSESFRVLMARNPRLHTLGAEWMQNQSLVESLDNQAQWSFVFFQKKPSTKEDKYSYKLLEWTGKVKVVTADTIRKMRVLLENYSSPEYLDQFESVSPQRSLEMEIVRGIYVPELVMWMHQILFMTRDIIPGNLRLSLDLANLVAGSGHDGLYEQFKRANKLGLFLRAMRESTLAMLSQSPREMFK
ncbi:hypothetical protein BASA50_002958 [Batrachochytrium salamandrivorans]|uniref:Nuclear pore complex protein n=1 Tax=Batrachochytrium salamandrivorans TaxID=1357716 RepID=A0ABQ8FK16_9FUNG|nr:hypothetical protein BASA50_002958 [Batrachochytrium salamandrivorans]